MPTRKVGKNCYRWGNQKTYCGKGARKKANTQGAAVRASQGRRKKRG